MIVGELATWEKAELRNSKAFAKAMVFLQNPELAALEPGKYEIEGDKLFALVSEPVTEPKHMRKPEAHDQFIDIQYLLSGEAELIYVSSRTPDTVPSEDYLGSSDIAFFCDVKDEIEVVLRPGMYAVFYPEDIHRPLCASGEEGEQVKKVVVKIHRELL